MKTFVKMTVKNSAEIVSILSTWFIFLLKYEMTVYILDG